MEGRKRGNGGKERWKVGGGGRKEGFLCLPFERKREEGGKESWSVGDNTIYMRMTCRLETCTLQGTSSPYQIQGDQFYDDRVFL